MRIETDFEAIIIDDSFEAGNRGRELSFWISSTEIDKERFLFLTKEEVVKLRDHLTEVLFDLVD